jgi:hypothetical protein
MDDISPKKAMMPLVIFFDRISDDNTPLTDCFFLSFSIDTDCYHR